MYLYFNPGFSYQGHVALWGKSIWIITIGKNWTAILNGLKRIKEIISLKHLSL